MFLVGYALGQILCTQFWKQSYKPRNYVPWSITLASYACDIVLLLALRLYLQAENARRDRALAASGVEGGAGSEDEKGHAHHNKYDENFGYVEKVGPDGNVVRQKVEKALLDLTVSPLVSDGPRAIGIAHGGTMYPQDRENLAFRYVL
jgi:MFS transporter, ACS family, DAL5 transporter family protein